MSQQDVTMIKKDAVIKIEVGAGFLQNLHQLMATLVQERSEAELNNYTELAKTIERDFPEPWMDNLMTVSSLVKTIEAGAVEQGYTYTKTTNTPDS